MMGRKYREVWAQIGHLLYVAGGSATPRIFLQPKGVLDPRYTKRLDFDLTARAMHGWAVEWARAAFPQVVVSHRHAAMLMSTTMAPDLVPDLVIPWPTFAIVLPDRTISALDPDGKWESVATAHIMVHDGEVRILASGESGAMWASGVQRVSNLGEAITDGPTGLIDRPLDEVDERMFLMLNRLFVGVCAELSSPEDQRSIAKGRALGPSAKGKRRRKADDDEPKPWTYVLKRDITINLDGAREAIHDYVRGGGRSPDVRSTVRAHWRNQRHGPKNSLVKWKEIKLYYRGDPDAPQAVRRHRLKDKQ